MLGSSWVAVQLAASKGLDSMKLVNLYFYIPANLVSVVWILSPLSVSPCLRCIYLQILILLKIYNILAVCSSFFCLCALNITPHTACRAKYIPNAGQRVTWHTDAPNICTCYRSRRTESVAAKCKLHISKHHVMIPRTLVLSANRVSQSVGAGQTPDALNGQTACTLRRRDTNTEWKVSPRNTTMDYARSEYSLF
jgi:hypothetical protein